MHDEAFALAFFRKKGMIVEEFEPTILSSSIDKNPDANSMGEFDLVFNRPPLCTSKIYYVGR